MMAIGDNTIISSDEHVFEPPELWQERLPSALKDRGPRLARLDDGNDWWVVGDMMITNLGAGAQPGVRFEAPEKLRLGAKQEDVRRGGYIPDERIKDMDLDGVGISIVYPTVGFTLFRLVDSELITACFSAYNDWIAEFCGAYPERLKGVALINVEDEATSVDELERCSQMGLSGALITSYPSQGVGYAHTMYEPFWTAAERLAMPLGMHLNTHRPRPGEHSSAPANEGTQRSGYEPALPLSVPSALANMSFFTALTLGDMVFSGVFQRHPALQVGSVEVELGWIPHFLERIDYTYTQRGLPAEMYGMTGSDMLPSDYVHQNVFFAFQEDELGIKHRYEIGVDNLVWGSDYPHQETTFPKSKQILEEILWECSPEEKAKITGGNAARIYHLN
jgi:predicted TIM-barrel fold metal-dependent hydrolase